MNNLQSFIKKRYNLFKTHLQTDSFFSENWLKKDYYDSTTEYVEFIRQRILDTTRDFNNNRIFTRYNIDIKVDKDLFGIDAHIQLLGSRQLLITLSIDLLLWIELNTIKNVRRSEITKSGVPYNYEPLKGKSTKSKLSDFFLNTIKEYDILLPDENGFLAIEAFFRFDVNYDFWGLVSFYSICFLINHELAHFLCGHTGFYLKQGGKEESEKFIERLGFVQPNYEAVKRPLKWSSELMADTYAIFRLAHQIMIDVDEDFYVVPEENMKDLDLTLEKLIAAPITGMCTLNQLNYEDENLFKSVYPPIQVRTLNLYLSIYFIWNPRFHQWYDARRNLISEWYKKRFPINKYFIYDRILYRNFIFKSWSGNTNKLYLPVETKIDQITFIGTMDGWRSGYTVTKDVLRKSNLTDLIYEYCKCQSTLCLSMNFMFSKHLKKEWFPEIDYEKNSHLIDEDWMILFGATMSEFDIPIETLRNKIFRMMKAAPLINDPAYKIMDDWMSNINLNHADQDLSVIFNENILANAIKDSSVLQSIQSPPFNSWLTSTLKK
ncbi:hypothetical protein Q4Q35_13775 [Flavivirga aquimarina]|uniref:Peptidase M48 domain-containing protein n=1 Tax=Flavivirga aquimarina TaxID=2027862 RepID=A0ABT8WCK8_9FLAO|nr:hypothetical protein [Flavivirga aquimarina]MDO5970877.1 hypothetical protein [Flavivirga aquimarina]